MSKNKSLLSVCLIVPHWVRFDTQCKDCQAEIQESGLLNDEEYDEWLAGHFNLGFRLNVEETQVV